jgi:hypothetical protein
MEFPIKRAASTIVPMPEATTFSLIPNHAIEYSYEQHGNRNI